MSEGSTGANQLVGDNRGEVTAVSAQCAFDADGNSIGAAYVEISGADRQLMVVEAGGVIRPLNTEAGETIGSCTPGETPVSCEGFAFGDPVWASGDTLCQKLTILATSNNPGAVEYSFDGGEFSSLNSFECGNGVDVTVVARDGAGCEVIQVFSNTRNLAADLWIGSNSYITSVTRMDNVGTQSIAVNGNYPAQFEIQNAPTTWEGYITTNELARIRGGTLAMPNKLRLVGGSVNSVCPVALDWQAQLNEGHTLQAADVLTVFMEFLAADGSVVEKRQLEQLADDFGNRTIPGSELVPMGAASADLVFESNTQGSTREHRVYLRANTFIKQRAA